MGVINMNRIYSSLASPMAKQHLQGLLEDNNNPTAYRDHMIALGEILAQPVANDLKQNNEQDNVLVVSTAEDADFLQFGVTHTLQQQGINTKLAIFWNNHYQLPNKTSVAPIVHEFIQTGYETTKNIVVVKSVISGSCVVRTNLLKLFENLKHVENVFIVSPVIYSQSEDNLKSEFPKEISDKFQFIYLAKDNERDETGEVIPGIGGQVYDLLGLAKQPVLTGYIPQVVKRLAFSAN